MQLLSYINVKRLFKDVTLSPSRDVGPQLVFIPRYYWYLGLRLLRRKIRWKLNCQVFPWWHLKLCLSAKTNAQLIMFLPLPLSSHRCWCFSFHLHKYSVLFLWYISPGDNFFYLMHCLVNIWNTKLFHMCVCVWITIGFNKVLSCLLSSFFYFLFFLFHLFVFFILFSFFVFFFFILFFLPSLFFFHLFFFLLLLLFPLSLYQIGLFPQTANSA